MMLIRIALAVLLAIWTSSNAVSAQTPSATFTHPTSGHFYEYYAPSTIAGGWSQAATFAQSRKQCDATGHLADLSTSAERNTVWNAFAPSVGIKSPGTWIGLNDIAVEGQHRWTTGDLVTDSAWASSCPSSPVLDFDCVAIKSGTWCSNRCGLSGLGALIEYDCPSRLALAGHQYLLYEPKVIAGSRQDAATFAASTTVCGVPGHLADFDAKVEADGVTSFLASKLPQGQAAWIGLTRLNLNNGPPDYRWNNGRRASYFAWAAGEPDYGLETCATIGFDGKWSDIVCSQPSIGALIEFDCPFIPTEINFVNDHRYEYYNPSSFSPGGGRTDAIVAVSQMNKCGVYGHLATLTSSDENQGVRSAFAGNMNPWIGLSDEETEGTFKWITGEAFGAYTNWERGKSTNTIAKDCAALDLTSGAWIYTDCALSLPVLVEFDCPIVPSTAPSVKPSRFPSTRPSRIPSRSPSGKPSTIPSAAPEASPSSEPSKLPSELPSARPSLTPIDSPSTQPSAVPSVIPSAAPEA